MRLTIASWNVLAHCYSREPWPWRWQQLDAQLRGSHADIFCLQEVDQYDSHYRPLLEDLGFASLYVQRPNKSDGCLLAYRTSALALVACGHVDLDVLAAEENSERFRKHNVAQFAHFRCCASQTQFVVGNCHLHWNPQLPQVKLRQAQRVAQALREFAGATPAVLCGDFNALPHSDVYRLLTSRPPVHAPSSALFGPATRFLTDSSLSRLCRWLRILGVDVAIGAWATDTNASKAQRDAAVNAYFARAIDEQRVILTTSRSLMQRSSCPEAFFVHAAQMEAALVQIARRYGLQLSRERFLTVCGKCGGGIEEADGSHPRFAQFRLPTDRAIFACVACAQPYWWSEDANSSPAKAMRKAEALFQIIERGLQRCSDDGDGLSLSQRFALRDGVLLQRRLGVDAALLDAETEIALAADASGNETALVCSEEESEVADAGAMEEALLAEGAEGETDCDGDALQQLRSVFATEPELTNWNGDFKGTLDYIFVSKLWKVVASEVRPKICTSHDSEEDAAVGRINGPLPSRFWPSDHLMICAEIEL